MQIPLYERCITPMCGRMVCVVLKDGTRHIGRLSLCREGKVYLNGGEHHHAESGSSDSNLSKSTKSKKNKKKSKLEVKEANANTTSLGYGPYGGPYGPYGRYGFGAPLSFDLGLIALLFLLFI